MSVRETMPLMRVSSLSGRELVGMVTKFAIAFGILIAEVRLLKKYASILRHPALMLTPASSRVSGRTVPNSLSLTLI